MASETDRERLTLGCSTDALEGNAGCCGGENARGTDSSSEPLDDAVRGVTFRLLLETGAPITRQQLARATSSAPDAIDAALGRLAAAGRIDVAGEEILARTASRYSRRHIR